MHVALSSAAIVLIFSGCSTIGEKWKQLISSGHDEDVKTTSPQKPVSFQSNPDFMTGAPRHYRRVTVDNFSDGQGLEADAGSLWRKEGQGSYLFSQNNLRSIGDVVSVAVDGKAAENLNTKFKIIKEAIAKLGQPSRTPERMPAQSPDIFQRPAPENSNGPSAQANQPPPETSATEPGASPAATTQSSEKPAAENEAMKFENVPCRITDRYPDGSYRIKGQETVYISDHEYKLIVTGVVKADDISTDVIGAQKLMDGRWDLVSVAGGTVKGM